MYFDKKIIKYVLAIINKDILFFCQKYSVQEIQHNLKSLQQGSKTNFFYCFHKEVSLFPDEGPKTSNFGLKDLLRQAVLHHGRPVQCIQVVGVQLLQLCLHRPQAHLSLQ